MRARVSPLGIALLGTGTLLLAACGARTSLVPPGSGGSSGRDGGMVGDAGPLPGDGGSATDARPGRDGGPRPADGGPPPPPPPPRDAGPARSCAVVEVRSLAETADGLMQWPTAAYLENRGLVVYTQQRQGLQPPMLSALPLGPDGEPAGMIVPVMPGEGGTLRAVSIVGAYALLARDPGAVPVVALLDDLGNLHEEPDHPFGELQTETRQPGFVVSFRVIGVALRTMRQSLGIVGQPEGDDMGALIELQGERPWAALSAEANNVVLFSTVERGDLRVEAVDDSGMRLRDDVVSIDGRVLAGRVVESRADRVVALAGSGADGPLMGIRRNGRMQTRPTPVLLDHVAAAEQRSGDWVLAAGSGSDVIQLFATDGRNEFAAEIPTSTMQPRPAVASLHDAGLFLVVWGDSDGRRFTLDSAVVRCE